MSTNLMDGLSANPFSILLLNAAINTRVVSIQQIEMKFKIKDSGFEEIRKKMILRAIPVALISVCGGLAIGHLIRLANRQMSMCCPS